MLTMIRRASAPALSILSFSFLLPVAGMAQSVQQLVVPAAQQHADGNSYLWASVGTHPVRMQTLIGPSHLQSLLGKELLAVRLRRHAADETYAGSALSMRVRLSHSPRTPLTVSRVPDDNLGPNGVTAFDGSLTLPTSPAEVGPLVTWDPDNTLDIPLATATSAPFVYLGGTLCVDMRWHELPGQTSPWWMADAIEEDLSGTATTLGTSCSPYGNGHSSWAAERSLIPGAYAQFCAKGTPGGLAFFAIGTPAAPLSLSQYGMPSNCFLYLDPASALIASVEVFDPYVDLAWQHLGGSAHANIKLPATGHIIGTSITAQWLDLSNMTTSDAVQATIGGSVPTLDMACVQTYDGETAGSVRVDLAYVLQFDYRTPQ